METPACLLASFLLIGPALLHSIIELRPGTATTASYRLILLHKIRFVLKKKEQVTLFFFMNKEDSTKQKGSTSFSLLCTRV